LWLMSALDEKDVKKLLVVASRSSGDISEADDEALLPPCLLMAMPVEKPMINVRPRMLPMMRKIFFFCWGGRPRKAAMLTASSGVGREWSFDNGYRGGGAMGMGGLGASES
jgi:hypothetical protein